MVAISSCRRIFEIVPALVLTVFLAPREIEGRWNEQFLELTTQLKRGKNECSSINFDHPRMPDSTLDDRGDPDDDEASLLPSL